MDDYFYPLQKGLLDSLTSGINTMRQLEKYTDIIITCHRKQFHAHRLILTATCPFFRDLFDNQNHNAEVTENVIHVDFVEPVVFKTILHFLYTGRLQMDDESDGFLRSLLHGARRLGVLSLTTYCLFSLLGRPSTENFFLLWDVIKDIKMDIDVAVFAEYAAKQFASLSKMDDFLNLSVEQLQEILLWPAKAKKGLDQEQLLDALISWAKQNWKERSHSFVEVVRKHVELAGLSAECIDRLRGDDHFRENVDFMMLINEHHPPIATRDNPTTREAIGTIISADDLESLSDAEVTRKAILFLQQRVDGMCEIQCYYLQTKEWGSVDIPIISTRSFPTVCGFSEHIFWIGGNENSQPLDCAFIYSFRTRSWEQIANLKVARSLGTAIVAENSVFILGGCAERLVLEVERYFPQPNRWQQVMSLPEGSAKPAVASLQGKIYYVGRYFLFQYDINADRWIAGKQLPQDLINHPCLVTEAKGKLYLMRKQGPKLFHTFDPAGEWITTDIAVRYVEDAVAILDASTEDKLTLCVVEHSGLVYLFQPPDVWMLVEKKCSFQPMAATLVDIPVSNVI